MYGIIKAFQYVEEIMIIQCALVDDSLNDIITNLMGKDSQPKKDFVFSRIDFEKYGEI